VSRLARFVFAGLLCTAMAAFPPIVAADAVDADPDLAKA
jgi:hypothetical protein